MRASRSRALLQAFGVSLALFWCAAPCWADGEGRRLVLVLARPVDLAAQPRLREELTAAGFAVVLSELEAGAVSPTEVVESAQRRHASAALLLKANGSQIQVCVIANDSARTSCRDVSVEAEIGRESAELLAIRAVEALRAALLKVSQPAAEREPMARPTQTSLAVGGASGATSRDGNRLALSLRAGASASPGGIGWLSAVGLAVLWRPMPALNLAVDGSFTPWARELSSAEGKASVTSYRVGPSATWVVGGANALLTAHVGGGVWLNLLALRGEPNPLYEDAKARIWSFIPHADLGLRFAVSRRLQVGPDSTWGYGLPGSAVAFAGRRVATWGRPVFVELLAIDAYLD